MFKKIFSTIIVLITFITLIACDEKVNNITTVEGTHTITHAMGTTNVPINPQRIVILTNEGTEALLAIGVKPVGAVKSWTGDPWYDHISSQMTGVQVVGTESLVNLEAIALLNPDLIIGNKMRQENIYNDLSLIAPTVFSETLRGEWKNNFSFYAKVLNLEDKGNEILHDYSNHVNEVRTLAESKGILNKEIAIIRFMAGKTRLYLNQTFSGIIFNEIGFTNRTLAEDPSGQDFAVELTKERLADLVKDAEIIFYFTYETGNGGATATEEEFLSSPLFQNLPATTKGNLIEVNDAIWNTAGGVIAANLTLDDLINKINTEINVD
ncbi:MAG: iron siderophore-binding protein [Haloplasmataceae bacterium]|nr:iron siderophore-binding protein [Haloplasmataceae bacterium]